MKTKILCTLTLECNNDCLSCFIPREARLSGDKMEVDQLLLTLDKIGIRPGDVIEITGGEPTTYPRIEKLLATLKKRYPARLVLVSNAENCSNKRLASEIAVSIDEIITNIYDINEATHDLITQSSGSLHRKLQGLTNLSKLGVGISLKLVPTRLTYQSMPDVVDELKRICLSPQRLIVKVLDLSGAARTNQDYLAVKLSEAAPYIEDAVRRSRPIFSGAELSFPLCLLEPNLNSPLTPEPVYDRIILVSANRGVSTSSHEEKEKPEICIACESRDLCNWFWKGYIELFGAGELVPYIRT